MSHPLEQKVRQVQDEEGKFKKEIWLVKCGQNRLRNQRPNQVCWSKKNSTTWLDNTPVRR
jgi:hypothetical protein